MVDDSYFVSTTIGLVDIKSIYDERGRHNFNSQCIHFPDSQVFEGHSTYSHNKYYFKMGLKIYYVSVIEIRVYCHFLCQTQFFFFNWAIQVSFPIINVGHAALPRPPSPHLPAHLICKSDWAFLELFRPCWNHFPCTKHFLSTLVLQSQTHFVHELAFHWYSHVWGKICLWDITKNSPSTDLDCTIPTSIQRVFMCFLFWDSFCTNI